MPTPASRKSNAALCLNEDETDHGRGDQHFHEAGSGPALGVRAHGAYRLLAYNPEAGNLIRGTGGIRKVRFAAKGKGKSGGVRVIYYYHSDLMPLYALMLYAKNEQAELTADDRKDLAGFVAALKDRWKARRQRHG